ncbi:zinc finger BED domain-containing protein RICESLEEPER 2 [Tanacetum coccineum]
MDQQTPQQNNPYESISSSIPTFDSFSSQQNMTIEDETIDVETLGNEDKKRKRKAPTRKPKAECWKYFDQKFENDEDGVLIKMAYCKWCPAVFKADSQRHDILCIQVSTVASESAFSASGRVLDPYRNSLAPNIVEALVCTQDWIRTSSRNITMDTLEDLMKDDELAKEIQEGLDKQKGEQGQGREKNVQA